MDPRTARITANHKPLNAAVPRVRAYRTYCYDFQAFGSVPLEATRDRLSDAIHTGASAERPRGIRESHRDTPILWGFSEPSVDHQRFRRTIRVFSGEREGRVKALGVA